MPLAILRNPSSRPLPLDYSYTASIPATAQLIYTAGHVGNSLDGSIIPSTFSEQVAQALSNLSLSLANAGAKPQDLIKITFYIVDHDEKKLAELEPVLAAFCNGRFPPATLVGVRNLATNDFLVEVDAIAAIK